MNSLEDSGNHWTCPSDRELTLRAKMRAGWSSRGTNNTDDQNSLINDAEQAKIIEVLERANKLEMIEMERIRKLKFRLDRIKSQAVGRGLRNCIICNEQPKFYRRFKTCKDCLHPACSKCCIDTKELDTTRVIWLCKICFESREMLKKSNKWTSLCNTKGDIVLDLKSG